MTTKSKFIIVMETLLAGQPVVLDETVYQWSDDRLVTPVYKSELGSREGWKKAEIGIDIPVDEFYRKVARISYDEIIAGITTRIPTHRQGGLNFRHYFSYEVYQRRMREGKDIREFTSGYYVPIVQQVDVLPFWGLTVNVVWHFISTVIATAEREVRGMYIYRRARSHMQSLVEDPPNLLIEVKADNEVYHKNPYKDLPEEWQTFDEFLK